VGDVVLEGALGGAQHRSACAERSRASKRQHLHGCQRAGLIDRSLRPGVSKLGKVERRVAETERVSLAIESELLARFDALIEKSGHGNRSEAMRDLMRNRLIEEEWATSTTGEAVATVTLVYDHTKRELADRLLEVGHDHHGAVIATLHVHLDHDNCLEIVALRGKPKQLRHIADHLIGMKGVKHGKVVLSSSNP